MSLEVAIAIFGSVGLFGCYILLVMIHQRRRESARPWCCHPDCDRPATWEAGGDHFDKGTDGCSDHLLELREPGWWIHELATGSRLRGEPVELDQRANEANA